jgi:hypothetical protein
VGSQGAPERLERSPEFALRAEGGEIFFVHASGARVVADALGAAIWESLPGSEDEVVIRVRETLNAPEELVRGLTRLMFAAQVLRAAGRDAQAPTPVAVERSADTKGRRLSTASTVSVVVVAYNSEKDIRDCLDSILVQTLSNIEVLVVDNASGDATARIVAEEYAGYGVRLIASGRNIHFAGGVNRGIRRSDGEYILVLNADTVLEPDTVARLAAKMDRSPKAAAVVPMMKFFDLRGFINGIGNSVRNYGWGSDNFIGAIDVGQFGRLKEVPSACFGAVLLRREALDRIGLLDPGYAAYYEDVDWSFRAWYRDWEIVPEPGAVVYHKFGASFAGADAKKMRLVVRNRQRLVLKLFRRRVMLGFFKRYLKEDLRGFAATLGGRRDRGSRRGAAAWTYARAYASLGLGLPGILFKRAVSLRNTRRGFLEAHVIQKNPDCWTYLDPRGLAQINAHAYMTYYRRRVA